MHTLAADKKYHNYFDMIFIDFDKSAYLSVLEDCIRLVRKGGFIIADNMSFPETQDYKEKVLHDSRLKTEIISVMDGMSCSERVR